MKVALIPIDNRPVCYTLPKEIASIDNKLELFLPERKLLGGLTSYANIDGIFNWLNNLLASQELDAIIISLDTIAYGGLVSSRRSKDTIEQVKSRMETFKNIIEGKCKKVYAFSSIMRISNNNVNEEEKKYWDKYGKEIFEYSYNFHKNGEETGDIPKEILSDYLATRQRNFSVNKMYLEWFEQGLFDTLVFSKDDCAEYGLNVLESEILQRSIIEKTHPENQDKLALVKTGADEIPLTLFARAVCDYNKEFNPLPKISTEFLAPEHIDLISNYEDISIKKSVYSQIELAGCKVSEEENSDIDLIINNFELQQGEIVMNKKTKHFSGKLTLPQKPFMIADVRFANGADNKLVEKLLKKELLDENFYGYSAWNTSANSLGSLLCAAVVKYFAKDYNQNAFKKLQMVRFLDDWAYQANVRQELKQQAKLKPQKETRPDLRDLKKAIKPYEKRLSKFFESKFQIKYKYPWKRFFEVEVIIK